MYELSVFIKNETDDATETNASRFDCLRPSSCILCRRNHVHQISKRNGHVIYRMGNPNHQCSEGNGHILCRLGIPNH